MNELMIGSVLPLWSWADRLEVTLTYSSYFILCLSVVVETSVNFEATDSVFIRCCRNVCFLLLWEVPTSPPPRRDGCSDVEARGEMYIVTRVRSFWRGLWWRDRQCYGRGCYGWWVRVVPTVSLVEDVGWLDPVG
jgi:hypothetical protein